MNHIKLKIFSSDIIHSLIVLNLYPYFTLVDLPLFALILYLSFKSVLLYLSG